MFKWLTGPAVAELLRLAAAALVALATALGAGCAVIGPDLSAPAGAVRPAQADADKPSGS